MASLWPRVWFVVLFSLWGVRVYGAATDSLAEAQDLYLKGSYKLAINALKPLREGESERAWILSAAMGEFPERDSDMVERLRPMLGADGEVTQMARLLLGVNKFLGPELTAENSWRALLDMDVDGASFHVLYWVSHFYREGIDGILVENPDKGEAKLKAAAEAGHGDARRTLGMPQLDEKKDAGTPDEKAVVEGVTLVEMPVLGAHQNVERGDGAATSSSGSSDETIFTSQDESDKESGGSLSGASADESNEVGVQDQGSQEDVVIDWRENAWVWLGAKHQLLFKGNKSLFIGELEEEAGDDWIERVNALVQAQREKVDKEEVEARDHAWGNLGGSHQRFFKRGKAEFIEVLGDYYLSLNEDWIDRVEAVVKEKRELIEKEEVEARDRTWHASRNKVKKLFRDEKAKFIESLGDYYLVLNRHWIDRVEAIIKAQKEKIENEDEELRRKTWSDLHPQAQKLFKEGEVVFMGALAERCGEGVDYFLFAENQEEIIKAVVDAQREVITKEDKEHRLKLWNELGELQSLFEEGEAEFCEALGPAFLVLMDDLGEHIKKMAITGARLTHGDPKLIVRIYDGGQVGSVFEGLKKQQDEANSAFEDAERLYQAARRRRAHTIGRNLYLRALQYKSGLLDLEGKFVGIKLMAEDAAASDTKSHRETEAASGAAKTVDGEGFDDTESIEAEGDGKSEKSEEMGEVKKERRSCFACGKRAGESEDESDEEESEGGYGKRREQGVVNYLKMIELLREAADMDYVPARAMLGFWLSKGLPGVAIDQEESKRLFSGVYESLQEVLEEGDNFARLPLAVILIEGLGGQDKNLRAGTLAFNFLVDEAKDMEASYLYAQYLWRGDNEIVRDGGRALNLMLSMSDKGHAGARYFLAQNYYEGVERKDAKDERFIETDKGLRLIQDEEAAVKYMTLAAGQGVPDALYHMALMCRDGFGGLKEKAGRYWVDRAIEAGAPGARTLLALLHIFEDCGVKEDDEKAWELLERDYADGNMRAAAWMAWMIDVQRLGDYPTLSCCGGCGFCLTNMWYDVKSCCGMPRSIERMRDLLGEAAAAGDPMAQTHLAEVLNQRKVCPLGCCWNRSTRQSVYDLLQSAADPAKGDWLEAQLKLAKAYDAGDLGLKKSPKLALDYWVFAAEKGDFYALVESSKRLVDQVGDREQDWDAVLMYGRQAAEMDPHRDEKAELLESVFNSNLAEAAVRFGRIMENGDYGAALRYKEQERLSTSFSMYRKAQMLGYERWFSCCRGIQKDIDRVRKKLERLGLVADSVAKDFKFTNTKTAQQVLRKKSGLAKKRKALPKDDADGGASESKAASPDEGVTN